MINSGSTPIFVFEKDGTTLTMEGAFRYESHEGAIDGPKWFKLRQRELFDQPNPFFKSRHDDELRKRNDESRQSTREERRRRLKEAKKTPASRTAVVTTYDRNEDVIAEVLSRAKGKCEWCGDPAPFIRRSNGTPYLEVHHVEPLSEGGEDTVENARGLCPNCHCKSHYGEIPNPFLHSTSSGVLGRPGDTPS